MPKNNSQSRNHTHLYGRVEYDTRRRDGLVEHTAVLICVAQGATGNGECVKYGEYLPGYTPQDKPRSKKALWVYFSEAYRLSLDPGIFE